MKLFLDTNVMIDYLGRPEGAPEASMLLHVAQMFADAEFAVSAKSYTDTFYIVSGYTASSDVQQKILDSLKLYQVCPIDEEDIAAACMLKWQDFEDALIMVAAEKCGADYLVTNDTGFGRGRVPTITPQGFLDKMAEHGVSYAVLQEEN